MTSRERIVAAWSGLPHDYAPLTSWCFGVAPPAALTWKKDGREVKYWYSKRMEHIHTTSQPWELEDDFRRVQAWQSLGVDDILEVSVPWSTDPGVSWEDSRIAAGKADRYPVIERHYHTPSGALRHAVHLTEAAGPGWVIQPDHVPLFEDLNIPRAVKHAVAVPGDVPVVKHLYSAPAREDEDWFSARLQTVTRFAGKAGVPVVAWSAFGMDGVVWLTGTEGAIMMAMDTPKAFGELVDIVHQTDMARTELAAASDGVDMVVMRGWYSSIDFWSPRLFEQFVFPKVVAMAGIAHKYEKKFCYVMTTGVEMLGRRLVDAGVDVLYFIDPVQDTITIERARELLGGGITLVGGISSLSLASGKRDRIGREVKHALEVLGPTNRFILQPVDALFPDTPWQSVEALIEAWKAYR